jgi:radical SAM superfamily enzyme YgiQ (UPF0313 family)
VNPPYPKGAPKSLFLPLGLAYLAAVLEEDGHEVTVLDLQMTDPTPQQLESQLSHSNADIVGVTTSTLTYWPAVDVVKSAKKVLPNALTVLGGPHVTALPEQTLQQAPEADIVVRGEGEHTILELAKLVGKMNAASLNGVNGITYRRNSQIYSTPDRAFIDNLDELPHPATNISRCKNTAWRASTTCPL